MKAPNKMMIAVGALALTATTLLAGCGGSSTASTAAASAPAAEVPTSVTEGMVKPADVSDENWLLWTESAEEVVAEQTPETFAQACAEGVVPASEEKVQKTIDQVGGTVEEWTVVTTKFNENFLLIACSMAE